jgi:2-polyprenyl-3-methyl-5-hydroxy-6-metoxy-1,4-benzoquinol methylase
MVAPHHRFIAQTEDGQVTLVRDFDGMYRSIEDPHGQRLSAANLAHDVYGLLIDRTCEERVRPRIGQAALRYLDVGCGLGCVTEAMTERLRRGGPVDAHGVDVSATAVAKAAGSVREPVTFQRASLLEPHSLVSLGRFHLVTCFETLYYFQDEEIESVLAALVTLVEPGGLIALSYHLPAKMSYGTYIQSLADVRTRFAGCRSLWEMDFTDALSTVYDGSRFGRHLFAVLEAGQS